MGHQGAHRSDKVRIFRFGACYRYDRNATEPDLFQYEVGDTELEQETWSNGTVLIYNPYALHPLPKRLLGAAAEMDLVGNEVVTDFIEEFHPYRSKTMLFKSSQSEDFMDTMVRFQLFSMFMSLPSVQAGMQQTPASEDS